MKIRLNPSRFEAAQPETQSASAPTPRPSCLYPWCIYPAYGRMNRCDFYLLLACVWIAPGAPLYVTATIAALAIIASLYEAIEERRAR